MGAVTSVNVTISSLRVHSPSGNWTTVQTTAQTYDLLELKAQGNGELIVQADLTAGTYDQFELNISKVVVVDASGSHEAKLPSTSLHIKATLEVTANAIATANFDFIASESLHLTGEGTYILAPVIQVETRSNAQVTVDVNNEVTVTGGTVTVQVKVGTDAAGNVDVGLEIGPNIVLNIDSSGKIIVVQGQAAAMGSLKAVDTASGNITVTTAGGTDLVLTVTSDTRINVAGSVSTLAVLAANIGSPVRVEYDTDTMVATSVVIQAETSVSATISGTLKAVNVLANTITVTTAAGADIELKVIPGTVIEVGSTVTALASLVTNIGSTVSVTYNAQTNIATKINVSP